MSTCRKQLESPTEPPARTGGIAAGGALLSSMASSACCWLPLLLLAFGASVTGLSAWFERYRLPFLIAAGVMLAFSFYSVYFRTKRCQPGSACKTAKPASRRVAKTTLWVSTVFIIVFAAFPKYIGALLPATKPAASTGVNTRTVTYSIEGMTCEACAVTLRHKLREVDGVADASVSYADRSATIVFENGASDAPAHAADAAKDLGYAVTVKVIHPGSQDEQLPPG